MKSILLTTTAIVAFAGAAVADGHTSVALSGSATLGYNDDVHDTITDDNRGFYWDANVAVAMSATLDNGVTAGASFDFDVADMDLGRPLESGGYVLSLTTENAGMYYGDTAFAAETRWVSAGDMEADAFSEADGETVIRGDVSAFGVDASVSYAIADADGVTVRTTNGEDTDQLSVGVAGTFGMFSVAAAYQEESEAAFGVAANTANGDFNAGEVYGVSAGVAFAGADITLAYAEDTTADLNSLGVKVAYPFGPVVATAYYVSEDAGAAGDADDNYGINVAYADGPIAVTADYQDDQGTAKWALEGSYDIGNGLKVYAGVVNDNEADEDYYVAGTYNLGGGAELLVSYAEDADGSAEDEVGANEYQRGTTVEVSFSF